MKSDVPKPEEVLRASDENPPQDLNGIAASPNSYYQLLLKKCRSHRALPASDRGQTNKG
jgi:hypothetical protein